MWLPGTPRFAFWPAGPVLHAGGTSLSSPCASPRGVRRLCNMIAKEGVEVLDPASSPLTGGISARRLPCEVFGGLPGEPSTESKVINNCGRLLMCSDPTWDELWMPAPLLAALRKPTICPTCRPTPLLAMGSPPPLLATHGELNVGQRWLLRWRRRAGEVVSSRTPPELRRTAWSLVPLQAGRMPHR